MGWLKNELLVPPHGNPNIPIPTATDVVVNSGGPRLPSALSDELPICGFKPAKVDLFRTDWSLIRCSRSVRPIFFSFEMSLLRMPSEPFTDGRRNPPTECWYKPLAGPVNIVQNGPART